VRKKDHWLWMAILSLVQVR